MNRKLRTISEVLVISIMMVFAMSFMAFAGEPVVVNEKEEKVVTGPIEVTGTDIGVKVKEDGKGTINGDISSQQGAAVYMAGDDSSLEVKGNVTKVGSESHDDSAIYYGTVEETAVNGVDIHITKGVNAENGTAVYGASASTGVSVLIDGDVKAKYVFDVDGSDSILQVNGKITISEGDDSKLIGCIEDEHIICTDVITLGKGATVGSTSENVYVYGFESADAGTLDCLGDEDDESALYKSLNYIIKKDESKGTITVTGTTPITGADNKTYYTAKGNSEIKIVVAQGYKLDYAQAVKNADGSYTVIVPREGKVDLKLVLDAIQKAEQKSHIVVSNGMKADATNAVAGEWAQDTNGKWSFTVNGTKATGWQTVNVPGDGFTAAGKFYFDQNGEMVTGWQLIDGSWYYFNEAPGNWQGALMTNCTTPDGYTVGSNGAWIA